MGVYGTIRCLLQLVQEKTPAWLGARPLQGPSSAFLGMNIAPPDEVSGKAVCHSMP